MNSFKASRVIHEFTQTNPASPLKIFPLLCPVHEGDWLPGWQYRLIYSDSGIAELGCVFVTPNPSGQAREETTWIVTEYDRTSFRISFLWIDPGRIITEIAIQLQATQPDVTQTKIRYRYTGLSEDGNRELEIYDRKWFETKMNRWETTMNYFLQTGERIPS